MRILVFHFSTLYSSIMFDPQELNQLKELFDHSEKRLTAKIAESEARVKRELTAKIEMSKSELSQKIGNFINDVLMPVIDDKADKSQIKKIKTQIGMPLN